MSSKKRNSAPKKSIRACYVCNTEFVHTKGDEYHSWCPSCLDASRPCIDCMVPIAAGQTAIPYEGGVLCSACVRFHVSHDTVLGRAIAVPVA